ncbi:hypothetical protein WJX81_000147 [Elliptochloris bilobata]|uniref:EH domain-containing protein n=1 Tax=Elliptochloris bilobata TaxID=381761 RepID=A0AAW1RFN8_9CHLO
MDADGTDGTAAAFLDLVPAELAERRRLPARLRPGPTLGPSLVPGGSGPLQAGTATWESPAARFGSGGASAAPLRPAVDGVPDATVDTWFAEADWDGDGRLAGAEAKAFFWRTGLPAESLRKIWNQVKATLPGAGDGLDRVQFASGALCACHPAAAGGGGLLFAGPSTRGGLLHWDNVEGDPSRPCDSGSAGADDMDRPKQLWPCNEDVDAAPAAEAHGSAVAFLIAPVTGQVVWSCSTRSLLLWCARSGAYLGALLRDRDTDALFSDLEMPPAAAVPPAVAEREERKHFVDAGKGLEVENSGFVLAAPPPNARGAIDAEQEVWAAQSDKKTSEFLATLAAHGGKAIGSAGKAAKFLGKLGQKLARNVYNEAGEIAQGHLRNAVEFREGDVEEERPRTQNAGEKPGALTSIASSPDGRVWAGFKHGRLEVYTSVGRLFWKKDCGVRVSSLMAVGARMWAGLHDGRIRVWEAAPGLPPLMLGDWQAHGMGVIGLALAGTRVVSLGADGSIKAWAATTPCEQDADARSAYDAEAGNLVMRETLEVLCLTWNVNESKPEVGKTLFQRLADMASGAAAVVVALQEIEMGGGSVAMAAAKDVLMNRQQERGNANAKAWQAAVQTALGGEAVWPRIGLRQLSGMLIMVFARAHLQMFIGEVATASVATGVLGVGGNKGAVAISFSLYRRSVACVCSHFAAHQGAVEARNANYAAVGQGMRDAEMVIWLGDFNYRIETTFEDAKERARRRMLADLLALDQLKREKDAGRIFRNFNEAPITFLPTYKFDKGSKNPCEYDTSEKRRVPAWTDRIFFRGSRAPAEDVDSPLGSPVQRRPGSPLRAALATSRAQTDAVGVQAIAYDACMDVLGSDHKPVWAVLAVDIPVTQQELRRRLCSELLQRCVAAHVPPRPRLELSNKTINLRQVRRDRDTLRIRNTGDGAAVWMLRSHGVTGQDASLQGLPDWLAVCPAGGVLVSQATVEVSLAVALSDTVFSARMLATTLVLTAARELDMCCAPAQEQRLQVVCHMAGSQEALAL